MQAIIIFLLMKKNKFCRISDISHLRKNKAKWYRMTVDKDMEAICLMNISRWTWD